MPSDRTGRLFQAIANLRARQPYRQALTAREREELGERVRQFWAAADEAVQAWETGEERPTDAQRQRARRWAAFVLKLCVQYGAHEPVSAAPGA